MASRFLFNETLWDDLGSRIPKAKHVRAAVAYLGSGASGLLPLRKGDKLVVDMSLRAVRGGTTDPREVQKFLRSGVEVFSRASLHAKFFVIDRVVIAGSANISKHARNGLDEAAILTDDVATVRRATSTFDQLCTEPVRKDYLKKCIQEYRPPSFGDGDAPPPGRKRKVTQSKLWIVSGLRYRPLPEEEEAAAGRVVERATKKLLDFQRSEVDYSHYASRERFFDVLREGDWVIKCIKDAKGFDVYPPTRFLGVEEIPRAKGKIRYLLLYETPTEAKSVRWSSFRRAVPVEVAGAVGAKPRTKPIASDADADALLRLWDARGRFKESKKT